MRPLCSYCSLPAQLVNGNVLYPHRDDLGHKLFWQCAPCDAYVGCHPPAGPDGLGGQGDGTVPLGRLANAELRRAKNAAHAAFDPLWRSGRLKRHQAYGWLAKQMGLNKSRCHIGEFDLVQCKQVLEVVATKHQTSHQTLHR